MDKKPSFMTSTFSIITLIVVIGFVILCIWLKDITSLKDIVLMVLSAYGLKKGMEVSNGSK